MTPGAHVRPVHVERTGGFVLPLPPDQALSLFTPEGERAWVPGWDAEFLHREGGPNGRGSVFRTTHGGEETFWIVLDYDQGIGMARYGRFTPGSRIGTVEIRCEGRGGAGTCVTVSYSLTAIAPGGNEVLSAMTPQAFTAMLEEWRTLIVRAAGC